MPPRGRRPQSLEHQRRKQRRRDAEDRAVSDDGTALRGKTHRRAYLRLLGARRLSEIEKALNDPDLISLRQELALIDQRMYALHEHEARGESEPAWEQLGDLLKTALAQFNGAELKKLTKREQKVLSQLETAVRLVNEGLGDYAAWREKQELILVRTRVADTERKYEELREHLISLTTLAIFFDDLHGAIVEVIPEAVLRWRLLTRIGERLNAVRSRTPVHLRLPPGFAEPSPAGDAPAEAAVKGMEADQATTEPDPGTGEEPGEQHGPADVEQPD